MLHIHEQAGLQPAGGFSAGCVISCCNGFFSHTFGCYFTAGISHAWGAYLHMYRAGQRKPQRISRTCSEASYRIHKLEATLHLYLAAYRTQLVDHLMKAVLPHSMKFYFQHLMYSHGQVSKKACLPSTTAMMFITCTECRHSQATLITIP